MKPNSLGEIDGTWTERPEFCPTRGLPGSLNKHAAANLPRKERRAKDTPVRQAQSKLLPFGGSRRGGFGRRGGRCRWAGPPGTARWLHPLPHPLPHPRGSPRPSHPKPGCKGFQFKGRTVGENLAGRHSSDKDFPFWVAHPPPPPFWNYKHNKFRSCERKYSSSDLMVSWGNGMWCNVKIWQLNRLRCNNLGAGGSKRDPVNSMTVKEGLLFVHGTRFSRKFHEGFKEVIK